MNIPSHGIPSRVCQVEHQVLRLIILGPSKDFGPVLEVCPCFFRVAAAEGGKAGEEFEEDAAQRPVVNGECVGLAAQDLRSLQGMSIGMINIAGRGQTM